MFSASSQSARRDVGFTLMELLVVMAIIMILAAIAFPVYTSVKQNSNKAAASQVLQQLASATGMYIAQNDGQLPLEDSPGIDGWATVADPANAKAWYNALPKILGVRTVAEYATRPRDYYTKENLLFLPGARYPANDKKLTLPLFAVAINTKLQRKGDDKNKPEVKIGQLVNASRTVLFLEQGLPDEPRSHPTQPKYDGSCKGSARSFVARYGEVGHLCFADGHVELKKPADLMLESGAFPFPVEPGGVIWTRSIDEDPNK